MSTAVIVIGRLGVYLRNDGTRGTVLAYVNEASSRGYSPDEFCGIARLAGLACEVVNKDGVGIVTVSEEDTAESMGVDTLVRVKGDWNVGFSFSSLSPSHKQDYYIASDQLIATRPH